MNTTLDDIIDDAGLIQHRTIIYNLLQYLRDKGVCINLDELSLITSSGSSIVVIPNSESKIVYQYYFNREIANNIVEMYQVVQCVSMCHYDLSVPVIAWQRLYIPDRKQLTRDIKKVVETVSNILDNFHQSGYIHGDPRLDNIGYLGPDNEPTYILFDFNLSRKSNRPEDQLRDRDILATSIRYHLG